MESDEAHQESAETGGQAAQDQDQSDTEKLEDNPHENQNLEAEEDDSQNVALVENRNSEVENSRGSTVSQILEKSDADQGVHDTQGEGEDAQVIRDIIEEEDRERESTISGVENSKLDSLTNEDKKEDRELLSGIEATNEPLDAPGAFDDAVVSDSLDTSRADSKNIELTTPQPLLATKNEELLGWQATDDSLGKPGAFNDALSDASEVSWLDPKNGELTSPELSPTTAKAIPSGQPSGRRSMRFQNQGDNLTADTSFLLPPLAWDGRPGTAQMHQWSYRPVSRFLRNPFYTRSWTCPKMYRGPGQGLTTTRYAGADKKTTRPERRWAREFSVEDRSVSAALSNPNPAATVPMTPRKWKKMTWMAPPEAVQEWKVNAEKEKAKKDRQKAQKQGYETLVGNIIYHDIPGAKDLNRSWKHFLDPDPMAWGFPYAKGSTERPRLPLPVPYLVHQMKEQLWKWPRNKLISQNTPSVSRVPSAGFANTSKTELNN